MSKPGTIYRIQQQSFDETEDIQTIVDISDMDNLIDDGDDPNIISLTASGSPVQLSVIDNDEDPFTPIKAQQCTIRFNSEPGFGMSLFLGGSDQRWYVHAYIGTEDKTVFKGFLVKNGMGEAFMPHPNIVELTANDGIGLLKEIPLTDFDGENPVNENRIIDYIAWAFSKTGLSLGFRVAFNIKQYGDNSNITSPNTDAEHFFYKTFLDAKTFEDEIGSCINCYEALKRILGEEAFCFQRQGFWWIVRVDEIESATRGLYVTSFDEEGAFVENLGEIHFDKIINKSSTIFFSREQTNVTSELAHKSVRLDYDYETPKEIVCNVDFSRGDYDSDIDSDSKRYDLDCWEKKRENWPTSGEIPADADIFLQRDFNGLGYEIARYVVIKDTVIQSNFIKSQPFPVHEKDKIVLGMSRRMSADVGGSGFYRDNGLQVRLIGSDGTYWTLQGETSGGDMLEWVASNSDFTINNKYLWFEGDVSRDMTESESLYGNTESPPIPVDGDIIICAHQTHQTSWGGVDTYIESVSCEYIPYVNGSYRKYSGQYHSTSQSGDYKSKRQKTVYISDSPKKLFKGALLKWNGTDYVLANEFYNAAAFPTGPPDYTYVHPYGEIQLFDVWNQFRIPRRVFQAVVQGLDLEEVDGDDRVDNIHLVHKYQLTDVSEHTLNRFFQLLTYNQDWRTGEWTGTLREVENTGVAKDYTNHEFKYKAA